MECMIPKDEFDSAKSYIETILNEPVEKLELTNHIPTSDEVTDSNTSFKGKLSILFVDMRKSTDLTDELKSKKMVKVYRSFIRTVIQAIRYSGGHARQFAGDGIMGVFQDDIDGNSKNLSSQKAVKAARYIITMIDYCLNPLLSKKMDGLAIGCGVGICTGPILITKVGMRGREKDAKCENETGIVWTGKTTNYASRHCGLASAREIFIDEATYKEINEKEVWTETTRVKGSKPFKGYTALEYYLQLPEDVNAEVVKVNDEVNGQDSFVQQIFDETEKQALALVKEIAKKSAELSAALESVKKREQEVDKKAKELEQTLKSNETMLKHDMLDEIIDKLTNEQMLKLGKDFFLERINNLSALYKAQGKYRFYGHEASRLLEVYETFEMYNKYYDALLIMADDEFPINEYKITAIIGNVSDTSELEEKLLSYYYRNDNEQSDRYKKYADMLGD